MTKTHSQVAKWCRACCVFLCDCYFLLYRNNREKGTCFLFASQYNEYCCCHSATHRHTFKCISNTFIFIYFTCVHAMLCLFFLFFLTHLAAMMELIFYSITFAYAVLEYAYDFLCTFGNVLWTHYLVQCKLFCDAVSARFSVFSILNFSSIFVCLYTYPSHVFVCVHSTALFSLHSACMNARMQFTKYSLPCEYNCMLEHFFIWKMPTILHYHRFSLHSFTCLRTVSSLRYFWLSTSWHVYWYFKEFRNTF